jgi:hypothetical protein
VFLITPGWPRFDRLHVSNDRRRPTQRFTRHREIIARRVDQVGEWLRSRPALRN